MSDFEIAPCPPEGETPRQFLLRVTGKDRQWLRHPSGRDYTWGEALDIGMMLHISRIVQGSPLPMLLYRTSSQEDSKHE